MGENKFMRSDPLTKGINAAPQRSLLKALGLCDAEIGKPLIGVVSSKNDIVPGHMNLDKIVDAVKATLEKTPPELAADVMDHGIMMTGGGALLKNLDQLLAHETGMPVLVAEDPLSCVGEGTGKSLENIELLKRVVMTSKKLRQ